MLISFNPGPSKVQPEVRQYMLDAYDDGLLQTGHRSERFTTMHKGVVAALRQKLNVPPEFHVYFTSSATECWEVIAQSLTRTAGLHFYNGSFGERWYTLAKAIRPASVGVKFAPQEPLDVHGLPEPKGVEVLCLTQNETSTATQIDNTMLARLASHYRDALVCVDATSSLGGLNLRYGRGDVWFGSVQKCLGLPAGLGVLICSPRAVERAKQIGDRVHYNALLAMHEKSLNFQTTHTPNVLGIYLLGQVLEARPPLKSVHDHLVARADIFYRFLEENFTHGQLFVPTRELRSTTVIAVEMTSEKLEALKQHCLRLNIQLGNGYGAWAKTTFRIANFPQHTDADFVQLQRALMSFTG